jgi:hypothetical protein
LIIQLNSKAGSAASPGFAANHSSKWKLKVVMKSQEQYLYILIVEFLLPSNKTNAPNRLYFLTNHITWDFL